jgi:hypothetical protein
MSMKSLNRLLGLSTIDARVLDALQQGQWSDLLQDFDFSPELITELSLLKADNYDEYLRAALTLVELAEAPDPAPFPEPTYRLGCESSPRGVKWVA